jgi:type I restriction enzyme M protein
MPLPSPKKSASEGPLGAKVAKTEKPNSNGGNLGFEAQLFLAADKLRKNLEPCDYKHVALGLIFLKYISNTLPLAKVL